MEKDSCHGGWAKGYWEGRMSALEDIYDLLTQRIDELQKICYNKIYA